MKQLQSTYNHDEAPVLSPSHFCSTLGIISLTATLIPLTALVMASYGYTTQQFYHNVLQQ